MILIRQGTFVMGSDETEIATALALCQREPAGEQCTDMQQVRGDFLNEFSPHEVFLSDFWIDRTEVTVARYRQCVAAGACAEPPYSAGGERFNRADFPVVLVTWADASAFCTWTGGRLPTEAEWERAARGISGRRYPWGNVYNPSLANHGRLALDTHDSGDGFLELAPVGSYADGGTPDKIVDLAGNVEEWVGDWYAPEYPKASAANPRGPDTGEERVTRGGSYQDARPWLRGAHRGHELPSRRRVDRGFRCAK
jgi:formylglycine-generating enzyme required for sulfatase activity